MQQREKAEDMGNSLVATQKGFPHNWTLSTFRLRYYFWFCWHKAKKTQVSLQRPLMFWKATTETRQGTACADTGTPEVLWLQGGIAPSLDRWQTSMWPIWHLDSVLKAGSEYCIGTLARRWFPWKGGMCKDAEAEAQTWEPDAWHSWAWSPSLTAGWAVNAKGRIVLCGENNTWHVLDLGSLGSN